MSCCERKQLTHNASSPEVIRVGFNAVTHIDEMYTFDVTTPMPMDSSARGARTVTPSVEAVLAFVNTRADGGGRQELLGDAEAFGSWLAEHGQFGGPATVTG